MKIGRLKQDKKLNYGIRFGRTMEFFNPLSKYFAVWFFKYKELPDEGSVLPGGKIKGLYYEKYLMTDWNIIVYTKSFRIPYWIRIFKGWKK